MASVEREPITGVWGRAPSGVYRQSPRLGGHRAKPPWSWKHEDRTSKGRGKLALRPCFKWEKLYSIAGFERKWWSDCHECHLESFLVLYTTEDSFI